MVSLSCETVSVSCHMSLFQMRFMVARTNKDVGEYCTAGVTPDMGPNVFSTSGLSPDTSVSTVTSTAPSSCGQGYGGACNGRDREKDRKRERERERDREREIEREGTITTTQLHRNIRKTL